MKTARFQKGFTTVEAVLLLLVIGVFGFVYFKVNSDKPVAPANTATTTVTAPTQAIAKDVPTAPPVTSTAELDAALTTLDKTDPASSNNADLAQLDSQLSSF